MKQDNKEEPKPARRFHISITLQNTLLGNKYCIYNQIGKNKSCQTYVGMNVKDGKDYLIKFYQLNQLQNDTEVHKYRYRIMKQAQIFSELDSPYIIKCYDVYENLSYLAVVYEYMPGPNLKQQIEGNLVSKDNYRAIIRHMHKAVQNIHQMCGILVKKIDLNNVRFKNGYYKLTGFDIFLSQKTQNNAQLAPQLNVEQSLTRIKSNKCDTWAIGLFYLQLLTKNQVSCQQLLQRNTQCLYIRQLQIQIALRISQNDNLLIRKCLMIEQQDRPIWQQLQEYDIFATSSKQNISNYSPRMAHDQITRTFVVEDFQCQNQYQQKFEQKNYILYFDEDRQYTQPKQQLPNSQSYTCSLNINFFSFQSLLQEDIKIYLSNKNMSEQKVYHSLQTWHFQAQKSKYILSKILMPIQKFELLEIKNKKNIQFMYLLSSRCFTNLSYVNLWMQGLDTETKQNSKKILKYYKNNLNAIYKKCQQYFNRYSQELTSAENHIFNMFRDKIKKLSHKQERVNQDKFLGGLEGIDYTKQQQIQFTCLKFLPSIIQEIEQNKRINEKIRTNMIRLLTSYKQICNINDSKQIRGKSFEQSISYIVNDSKKQTQNRRHSSGINI